MSEKIYRIFGLPIWKTEFRDSTDDKLSTSILSGISNTSSYNINKDTALKLSGYIAVLKILSETIAMLPIQIFEKKNDSRIPVINHPAYRLLKLKPNQLMTSFKWKETMQIHATSKGNGYSIIFRNGLGEPVDIRLVDNPDSVEPFIFEGNLFYKIEGYEIPFNSIDIFHIKGFSYDGIKGLSLLKYARDIISSGLAQQDYSSKAFTSGGSKRLTITSPQAVKPEVEQNIVNSWNSNYNGINNIHKVAFLQAGMDVKEIGFSPSDMQVIESKSFTIEDLSRISLIPLHRLSSMKQSTNNNIEQQSREFIDYTMMPHFTNWESEINDKLLKEKEKLTVYSKFNVSALLRGDMNSRANYLSKMVLSGIYSQNEAREYEDKNSIEGHDSLLVPVNMSTIENINNNNSDEQRN